MPPDIAAWLVDLDGTLYRQFPVRLAMACELALFGRRDIRVISRFRKEQEALRKGVASSACPYQTQLERTAVALGREVATFAPTVSKWMEERPGRWLRIYRRRGLLAQVATFQEAGGRTALVSDYPARRKLAALEVEKMFDSVVACGEPGGPLALKPSPQGYLLAAERLGVEPSRCLVIGDRDDADGEAARRAGMRFWLVR
jgi:HAD superfamily hydrolase (TIGR01549 family)